MSVRTLTVGLCLVLVQQTALAEKPEWRESPLGHRFDIGVSAFFADVETTVRLDGPNGELGTTVNFERALGLDSTKTRPLVGLKWRFFKRHSLRFDYFNLDRSGDQINEIEIRFGDVVFPIDNIPLESFVDIEVYNLGYDFSILFDEKKNWYVGLGLSLQDFEVGIRTNDDVISEAGDATAPLPTFVTGFQYAFTPKWILDLNYGWLEVDVDFDSGSTFDGSINAINAGVAWQVFKHVGFHAEYRYFDVEIDVQDPNFTGSMDYQYKGPSIGIDAYF